MGAVRPAREDHREFGCKRNRSLSDGGLAADRIPGRFRLFRRTNPCLALAVIAVAAGLEDQRQTEPGNRTFDILERCHGSPRRDARAGRFDEAFLLGPVLGDRERLDAGTKRVAKQRQRLDRQILELVSGDVDPLGEIAERGAVVEVGAGEMRRDIGGAGPFVRIEDMAFVAELGGRDAQHPAELAAPDYADRGPGRNDHSGDSATDPVCRSRHSSRRFASAASPVARMAAASNPALTAPALPMANVPTGTPAGI